MGLSGSGLVGTPVQGLGGTGLIAPRPLLSQALPNIEFEVDPSLIQSYDGVTATLKNVVQPSSGEAQSSYNFPKVGAGSLFVGTPGTPSMYMQGDGSTYLQMAASTGFLDINHQDTYDLTKQFWFLAFVRRSSTTAWSIMSNTTGTDGLRVTGSQTATTVRSTTFTDSNSSIVNSNATFTLSAWELVIGNFLWATSNGGGDLWLDGVQKTQSLPTQYTSVAGADGALCIGANPGGTAILPSGYRMRTFAMGRGKLQASQIHAAAQIIEDRYDAQLNGWTK